MINNDRVENSYANICFQMGRIEEEAEGLNEAERGKVADFLYEKYLNAHSANPREPKSRIDMYLAVAQRVRRVGRAMDA